MLSSIVLNDQAMVVSGSSARLYASLYMTLFSIAYHSATINKAISNVQIVSLISFVFTVSCL